MYNVSTKGGVTLQKQNSKETAKLFKSGNSFGIRLTKKDVERMHLQSGDEFKKIVSPDGRSVTFKKEEPVSNEMLQKIKKTFDKNKELMERLNDE